MKRDCLTFCSALNVPPEAWINMICHHTRIHLLLPLQQTLQLLPGFNVNHVIQTGHRVRRTCHRVDVTQENSEFYTKNFMISILGFGPKVTATWCWCETMVTMAPGYQVTGVGLMTDIGECDQPDFCRRTGRPTDQQIQQQTVVSSSDKMILD